MADKVNDRISGKKYDFEDDKISLTNTNPFDDTTQQIYAERKCIQKSLGLLYETEEVGKATVGELAKQDENLETASHQFDEINSPLRFSQRHLSSLKNVFGGLKNYLAGNRDGHSSHMSSSISDGDIFTRQDDFVVGSISPGNSSSASTPLSVTERYDNRTVSRISDDCPAELHREQLLQQRHNNPFKSQLEAKIVTLTGKSSTERYDNHLVSSIRDDSSTPLHREQLQHQRRNNPFKAQLEVKPSIKTETPSKTYSRMRVRSDESSDQGCSSADQQGVSVTQGKKRKVEKLETASDVKRRTRSDESPDHGCSSADQLGVSMAQGKKRKKRRKVEKHKSSASQFETPQSWSDEAAMANKTPCCSQSQLHTPSALTAVITLSRGHGPLSQRQLDFVDSHLWKFMGEETPPTFEGMEIKDGIMQVQCTDTRAFEWLSAKVALIPAFEGSTFSTSKCDYRRLVRATIKIYGRARKSTEIVARLRMQNQGLDTSKWRIYSYTECGKEAFQLVLGVDVPSVKILKENFGMRPHLFLGRVNVHVQEAKEAKEWN